MSTKEKLLALILIVLFLCTRFFRINETFFFFNDMGRDLLELYELLKYGDVPLFGPQTSALPINQSPIYYYALLPFYVLSGLSPYSALFFNTFVYISCFITSLFMTRKYSLLKRGVMITFFLMIFHPQHILQNRFVWNPSLLPPLLTASIFSFLVFSQNKKAPFLYSALLLSSLGVALHYSAIPVVFVFLIITFLYFRKFALKAFAQVTMYTVVLHFTTLLQLINRLAISGYVWRSEQVFQTGSNYSEKLTSFFVHVLGINQSILGILFFIIILFFAIRSIDLHNIKNRDSVHIPNISHIASVIFLLTLLFTILSPFNLQAHYIFAITSALFVFLSLLDKKIVFPIVVVLMMCFLQPSHRASYFVKSPRTYAEMETCYTKICRATTVKEPVFVSTVSSLYPYHYGPEHRYIFLKSGCDVRHIEKDPQAANIMLVVLDKSTFSKDIMYYELELFGEFTLDKEITCTKNLGVVILRKQNDENFR